MLAATDEDPVPIAKLSRQPFLLTVPSTGEIVGLETTSLVTPETSSGSMTLAWLIPEGSFVQPGDTVVRFDGTDAELNLEKRPNTLLRKPAEHTRLQHCTRVPTRRRWQSTGRMRKKDYEYAMTILPEDESIFSKWDIITAQADANYDKERIDFLKSKEKTQRRIARSDQQILAIERNKAQSEVSIIQGTLNSLELKATVPGLVLYKRERMEDPKIGDECHPGQAMVELVNLDILQARTYVLERDGGNLEKGLPVVLKLDAIPDKQFHGTISSLSSVAGSIDRDSTLRYFTCDVAISDAGKDLKRIRPGMNLKADVVLEQYDSCFVVPSSAISVKENKNVVYVQNENDFIPKPVDVGLGSHGEAVILGGLEEGELIALRNPFETRQLHLPDFSKGTQDTMMGGPGGPGGMNPGMMRRMMGGGGMGGRVAAAVALRDGNRWHYRPPGFVPCRNRTGFAASGNRGNCRKEKVLERKA